jgi:alanine dehydrogenase
VLARPGAAQIAVIGTGTQAWAQPWAICAVRALGEARIRSRTGDRRERLAQRARDELGVDARPALSAEHAVRDAGIVVLAASSPVPVIDAAWIAEGCHVTSLGPKQRGRAELDPALAERADVLVTDSLAQVRAY